MKGVFAGRSVIVTGGASGIGLALGEELVRRGARVWLADRDGDGAHAAASACRGAGEARGAELDVTDAAAVDALCGRVADEAGALDLVFNNAGVLLFGAARHTTLADWRRLVEVNLMGVVHGVAAAYPRMIAQGHGHIVNTASAAGLVPIPGSVAYGATKHAVVGLSTALRLEAERHGVRVSVACPGMVETPIVANMQVVGVDRDEAFAGRKAYLPVEQCVRTMLAGVARNRAVIVLPARARTFWWIQRHAPRIATALLRRAARRSAFLRDDGA
jgi:NAD(P)-dependent dehydrogenase (short-subunit alcohol dehydrogenase family)